MADVDFVRLGIGGITNNFNVAFSNAFESRILPELGSVDHTRGVLIFGPNGCGKTFLAKQMAKALTPLRATVLNCAKLLQSPKMITYKVNKLFEEAEIEHSVKGDTSLLYVFILDEVDALMRPTTPEDELVRSTCSYVWDKVDKVGNVLIVGLTKNRELVDPSFCNAHYFSLVVGITKPTDSGRLSILKNILLQDFSESLISLEVENKLQDLANMTKGFTPGELEGLLRSAVAFAHARESEHELAELRWMDVEKALVTII